MEQCDTFVEFKISPEVSEYDTLTVYRKTYTQGYIDMSILGEDFSVPKEEVKELIKYLQGRVE